MGCDLRHEWIPLERVGPLAFDAPIEPHLKNGTLVPAPFEDGRSSNPEGERFAYPDDRDGDDISVYVKNGRIESILCDYRCVLRGRNLIGLDYETFRELIGSAPAGGPEAVELIDEWQDQYDFDAVGAGVWVQDGIVLSVDCNGWIDEYGEDDAGSD